ncbi:unnamed protein product [Lampetra planeri]
MSLWPAACGPAALGPWGLGALGPLWTRHTREELYTAGTTMAPAKRLVLHLGVPGSHLGVASSHLVVLSAHLGVLCFHLLSSRYPLLVEPTARCFFSASHACHNAAWHTCSVPMQRAREREQRHCSCLRCPLSGCAGFPPSTSPPAPPPGGSGRNGVGADAPHLGVDAHGLPSLERACTIAEAARGSHSCYRSRIHLQLPLKGS